MSAVGSQKTCAETQSQEFIAIRLFLAQNMIQA